MKRIITIISAEPAKINRANSVRWKILTRSWKELPKKYPINAVTSTQETALIILESIKRLQLIPKVPAKAALPILVPKINREKKIVFRPCLPKYSSALSTRFLVRKKNLPYLSTNFLPPVRPTKNHRLSPTTAPAMAITNTHQIFSAWV